jgi:hypothetical protein
LISASLRKRPKCCGAAIDANVPETELERDD